MKIAIIGATGVVGAKMIRVLEEHNLILDELIVSASDRSVGKKLVFLGRNIEVISIEETLNRKPNIALFSAGGNVSKEWAPRFAAIGCTVVDNSSAWRMDNRYKLIVPEVNACTLTKNDKIISNPNCSTIQLVHVLSPLHKKYGLKRVVVSTYQSVSGSGIKGIRQLENERKGIYIDPIYPHPIDMNCLPHGGDFLENGYTSEEMKLIYESRKILGLPDLKITGTVVRVPVTGGHSESVNISFEKTPDIEEMRKVLSKTHGIIIQDSPEINLYPMPITAEDRDETFVGRIRLDESATNSVNLWIVADNLRKGAATNSVQIAEYLIEKKFV
jgi:aspartate-semialdehyde dehydrogenase